MVIGNYNGGKGNLYQKIINLQPPHDMYVELFLGGGSVMNNKRPAIVNVGIDLDEDVIAEWRCTIVGNDGAAASSKMAIGSGMGAPIAVSGDDTRWEFHRIDALEWLRVAVLPSRTLIYADPPYLLKTRSLQRDLYKHEMKTEAEHRTLLEALLGLDCMVMVSGYWSKLYAKMLTGWNTAVFDAYTRSGRKVKEYVWMNYPLPDRLHDYSHLGDDFRERERIKRKKTRWVKRLKKMPRLERQAILAAMDEAGVGV